ncbi:MAG: cyclomaltodextrinase N-terminal domain-containing protein, partial [Bacteroidota bacterium]
MKKRSLVLFCLILVGNLCLAQTNEGIKRIEPPFWWVGMKSVDLQLLIYGDGISQAQVSLDYPGVRISKSTKLENPNYLFVDLEVDAEAK